jgi:hypothetical protein
MSKRTLFLSGMLVLLALVLAGCTLGGGSSSRITPTPTKTTRPLFTSTTTPTPSSTPTNTPLPTNTPVPPTETPLPPTDTPAPPTEAPTDALPTATAEPPTDTPQPAAPTNTPKPKPTNTPAPPTNTPKPQVDFQVVEQRLMPKAENEAGLPIVFIRVEDAAGNGIPDKVIWDPNYPDQVSVSGTKPEPYHAEFRFWYLYGYRFEIKGTISEKTKVLSTDVHKIPLEDLVAAGYCTDVSSCNLGDMHFSWYVTFRRTW